MCLLGIHISNGFSDKNVFHTVHKFNRKCNELRYDFKLLPSDVKSQLFSSFGRDAYGSQPWNFDSKMVELMAYDGSVIMESPTHNSL